MYLANGRPGMSRRGVAYALQNVRRTMAISTVVISIETAIIVTLGWKESSLYARRNYSTDQRTVWLIWDEARRKVQRGPYGSAANGSFVLDREKSVST